MSAANDPRSRGATPHAPEGPALPPPDQLRAGRRIGATAGALGCLVALVFTYSVSGWELLGPFGPAVAVAVVSVLAMGWTFGPRLVGPTCSTASCLARGAVVGLSTLLAAALIGATTQVIVEHLTPMPPPLRMPRPVDGEAILLGTVGWVMILGSLPATLIGAAAALRLGWVSRRAQRERVDAVPT